MCCFFFFSHAKAKLFMDREVLGTEHCNRMLFLFVALTYCLIIFLVRSGPDFNFRVRPHLGPSQSQNWKFSLENFHIFVCYQHDRIPLWSIWWTFKGEKKKKKSKKTRGCIQILLLIFFFSLLGGSHNGLNGSSTSTYNLFFSLSGWGRFCAWVKNVKSSSAVLITLYTRYDGQFFSLN